MRAHQAKQDCPHESMCRGCDGRGCEACDREGSFSTLAPLAGNPGVAVCSQCGLALEETAADWAEDWLGGLP